MCQSAPSVGIITALSEEYLAVRAMLDDVERIPRKSIELYDIGRISSKYGGSHVVVLTQCGKGNTRAALRADALLRAYPGVNHILMVGIAGGIPKNGLRLGDIVVSNLQGVIKYDMVKVEMDRTTYRHPPRPPSSALLSAVEALQTSQLDGQKPWLTYMRDSLPYMHGPKTWLCPKKNGEPSLFTSPIASADTLLKNTVDRDNLYSKFGVLACEMEGSGIADATWSLERGYLVVRGISDFCNMHKNDRWHKYAALAAAACAKAIVAEMAVDKIAPSPSPTPPETLISLHCLPDTALALFGRAEELARLDAAWERNSRFFSLVAEGGTGKSAVANAWMEQLRRDGWRGAERVFGWSFYSQGAERQASADTFLEQALLWFGDPTPSVGESRSKGSRLATLVGTQRTLLLLDGLEPLQEVAERGGKVRDPGLDEFLKGLAYQQKGLCLITTRVAVAQLAAREKNGTAERINLEHLSCSDGAALLDELGVKGRREELEKASQEMAGHCLALTLLGTYLVSAHEGKVQKRDTVPPLAQAAECVGSGGHARRVMEGYVRMLGEGSPETAWLYLIGLFDRPANPDVVAILLKTSPLFPVLAGESTRAIALARLTEFRLITRQQDDVTLDSHPLVRQHFAERFKNKEPQLWDTAQRRLYKYFLDLPKKYCPDTLEEMEPLFRAVTHGCQAGLHQEVLDDVYWPRIQRYREYYVSKKLGATGQELVALTGFFVRPWQQLVVGLRKNEHSILLNWAGNSLQAQGRLREAVELLEAAWLHEKEQSVIEWDRAIKNAGNLSDLYLILGETRRAVDWGREGTIWSRERVAPDEKGEGGYLRLALPTALAAALHQAGDSTSAEQLFQEAESLQCLRQPQYPQLYALPGYRYCALLLEQGRVEEVLERTKKALVWDLNENLVLGIALDHLSLGRANIVLAMAGNVGNWQEAEKHLTMAVTKLKSAGRVDYLPAAILAHAEYYRAIGNYTQARQELDEAREIAQAGEMGRYLADLALEEAELARVLGQDHTPYITEARELAINMGYGQLLRRVSSSFGAVLSQNFPSRNASDSG